MYSFFTPGFKTALERFFLHGSPVPPFNSRIAKQFCHLLTVGSPIFVCKGRGIT